MKSGNWEKLLECVLHFISTLFCAMVYETNDKKIGEKEIKLIILGPIFENCNNTWKISHSVSSGTASWSNQERNSMLPIASYIAYICVLNSHEASLLPYNSPYSFEVKIKLIRWNEVTLYKNNAQRDKTSIQKLLQ